MHNNDTEILDSLWELITSEDFKNHNLAKEIAKGLGVENKLDARLHNHCFTQLDEVGASWLYECNDAINPYIFNILMVNELRVFKGGIEVCFPIIPKKQKLGLFSSINCEDQAIIGFWFGDYFLEVSSFCEAFWCLMADLKSDLFELVDFELKPEIFVSGKIRNLIEMAELPELFRCPFLPL